MSGMRREASPSRGKWLHARLKTEMLRLSHFHHIAARIAGNRRYQRRSRQGRRAFSRGARSSSRSGGRRRSLDRSRRQSFVVSSDRKDETRFEAITPMMPAERVEIPQVASDVFDVWRVLRVKWQANYCDAKLEHRHQGRADRDKFGGRILRRARAGSASVRSFLFTLATSSAPLAQTRISFLILKPPSSGLPCLHLAVVRSRTASVLRRRSSAMSGTAPMFGSRQNASRVRQHAAARSKPMRAIRTQRASRKCAFSCVHARARFLL